MGFDFQQDPLLARLAILVGLVTHVFFRHLVDVTLSHWSRELFDNSSPHHDELVRIALFGNCQSDLRVLFDIPVFHTAHRGVDQYVVTVGIDPCWSDLRSPIRVDGCEKDEVFSL